MVQIYIINLKDRTDRLASTMNELRKVGIDEKNIHVIEAVDTRNSSLEDIQARFPSIHPTFLNAIRNGVRSEHHELTSGAIGCFYSHVKAWDAILANPKSKEISVILEDDIRFTNYFRARQFLLDEKKLGEKLKSSNIYLLGHTGFHKDHHLLKDLKPHLYPEDIVVDWFMGLHSYSLNRDTANILHQHLRIPSKQVDWSICDMIQSHKLIIKALVNRVTKVLDLDSDIQLDQPCLKEW